MRCCNQRAAPCKQREGKGGEGGEGDGRAGKWATGQFGDGGGGGCGGGLQWALRCPRRVALPAMRSGGSSRHRQPADPPPASRCGQGGVGGREGGWGRGGAVRWSVALRRAGPPPPPPPPPRPAAGYGGGPATVPEEETREADRRTASSPVGPTPPRRPPLPCRWLCRRRRGGSGGGEAGEKGREDGRQQQPHVPQRRSPRSLTLVMTPLHAPPSARLGPTCRSTAFFRQVVCLITLC